MLQPELKPYLHDNFAKTYKELLTTKVFQNINMYKQLFKNPKAKIAFDNAIEEFFNCLIKFYEQNPNGSYINQLQFIENNTKLKNYISQYTSVTNDKTFFNFLKVYGYCVEQLNGLVLDNDDKFDKNGVNELFERAFTSSMKMYDVVKKDMDANNYWWLRDTATTLRRQLEEDITLINSERLQKMFDKYFTRKVDIAKEFMHDGNMKLIQELDKTMYENKNALPYYFWWDVAENGQKKLMMGPQPPKTGVYTFVAYQNYTTAQNQKNTEKEYYM